LYRRLLLARDASRGMEWLHGSTPQILHRDLKPANLLVDEHWNVKLCDFGLSSVKDPDVPLRVGKTIPGTPLWMAPEVLMAQPVDTKADVYSFGLVLWEMVTGEPLFPHHNNYQEFRNAIVKQKERPPIPTTLHASVATLMQRCWEDDKNKRSAFSEITNKLMECIQDSLLDFDPVAHKLWVSNFNGKMFCSFNKILEKLRKISSTDSLDGKYKLFDAIKMLIATKNEEPDAEDPLAVTLPRFSNFVTWFGPLGPTLFKSIEHVAKEEWFFGDLEKSPAEAALANTKGTAKGSYLVRLSTSDPAKPFSLSRVDAESIIRHHRIGKSLSGEVSVEVKGKNNAVVVFTAKSLSELIPKIKKDLKMEKPCPGSPYQQFLNKGAIAAINNPYDL